MDWNIKSPMLWDWGNQGLFSEKEGEVSVVKSTNPLEWAEEEEEEGGTAVETGSVYSSVGGAFSGSDLGNGSSRSSVSASGGKVSGFSFEVVDGFPKNVNKNIEVARMEDTGISGVVSAIAEPMIGLKLGKRTYFEDVCSGNNAKNVNFATSLVPSAAMVKKTRVSHQSIVNSRCQVEGCNIDLAGAKDYHRKHRVCESHAKCAKVIIAGQERRFCQQCSRFHELSQFDQKKRSCRRRLSDHNARRRKPHSDTISFNTSGLLSPYYGDKQQISFVLNSSSLSHTKTNASSRWEGSFSLTHSKGSWIKSVKPAGMDSQLQFSNSELRSAVFPLPHDLDKVLSFKDTTAEVLSPGLEAPIPASNLNRAPDLRHAPSLLSTDSWGQVHHGQSNGQSSLPQLVNTSHDSETHPQMQTVSTTTMYWQDQQRLPQNARVMLPSGLQNNLTHFQEISLPKSPYMTPFFDSGHVPSKSDGHFLEFKT